MEVRPKFEPVESVTKMKSNINTKYISRSENQEGSAEKQSRRNRNDI